MCVQRVHFANGCSTTLSGLVRQAQGGAQNNTMPIFILVEGGGGANRVFHTTCACQCTTCAKLTNLMPDGVTEADVYDVDNNLSVDQFCTLTPLT